MKILHIAECAGGVERYLQMLLPRLEARGMTQFFICSRNYDECIYLMYSSICNLLME